MNTGRVFGILPVKSLRFAKRRLSGRLSDAARRCLAGRLYCIAIRALSEVLPADQIVVVSCDRQVLDMARRAGVQALKQASHGLNPAVEEGQAWAMQAGAEGLLIVLGDLPLVSGAALQGMLDESAGGQEVILARGQRGGTHALFVRPPGWLPFRFGEDSCAHFASQVSQAGARLVIHESRALALDVDVPEDLEQALALRPGLLDVERKET
jgi:2-phospho-L-lactate guanylyltransferase